MKKVVCPVCINTYFDDLEDRPCPACGFVTPGVTYFLSEKSYYEWVNSVFQVKASKPSPVSSTETVHQNNISDTKNNASEEKVIKRAYRVANGDWSALFTDDLILTSKRIVCVHKGVFGSIKNTDVYLLKDIKIRNGIPQITCGKSRKGYYSLDIEFNSGKQRYQFNAISTVASTKYIDKWIDAVKSALGTVDGENIQNKSTNVPEMVKCVFCGSMEPNGAVFCSECGKNITPVVESQNKFNINQQIELLEKLKALVDAGILSQEEFEIKKKEIMQ